MALKVLDVEKNEAKPLISNIFLNTLTSPPMFTIMRIPDKVKNISFNIANDAPEMPIIFFKKTSFAPFTSTF